MDKELKWTLAFGVMVMIWITGLVYFWTSMRDEPEPMAPNPYQPLVINSNSTSQEKPPTPIDPPPEETPPTPPAGRFARPAPV